MYNFAKIPQRLHLRLVNLYNAKNYEVLKALIVHWKVFTGCDCAITRNALYAWIEYGINNNQINPVYEKDTRHGNSDAKVLQHNE
jgi:hypothetical protein